MLEATQRIRDEMDLLTCRLNVYLTAAQVMFVIFAVRDFLKPGELFTSLPTGRSYSVSQHPSE